MELKEFVSETLQSIMLGVRDAQLKAKDYNSFVNPSGLMRNTSNVENNAVWDNSSNNYAQTITFDIAITAEDSTNVGAKIKVLSVLGGDFGGGIANKNTVVSRVQFSVPVLFPGHDVKKPEARKSVKH